MDVKKLQRKIIKSMTEWDKLKRKKYVPETAFYHLVEEVGELSKELVNERRRPEKYSKEKLIDAIGDILIYTVLLASLYKVDIEKLILNIIKQDKKRMKELKTQLRKK
jgi:NTP pyrophosphatase (non-canonical NTP hydrolase)